jgi:hypothetical protein
VNAKMSLEARHQALEDAGRPSKSLGIYTQLICVHQALSLLLGHALIDAAACSSVPFSASWSITSMMPSHAH